MSGMIIHIRGLEVRGNHGVLPEERELGQPFIIDVAMEVSSLASCASDALGAVPEIGVTLRGASGRSCRVPTKDTPPSRAAPAA